MARKRALAARAAKPLYDGLVGDIAGLLAAARRASSRAVNALITAGESSNSNRAGRSERGMAKSCLSACQLT
jgi:hypothetical protein